MAKDTRVVLFHSRPEELKKVVSDLKQLSVIRFRPHQIEYLSQINRYSMEDDERAYLLGLFFSKVLGARELPSDAWERLLTCIRQNRLEAYFNLTQKPSKGTFADLPGIFIFLGMCLLFSGGIQLWGGNVPFGQVPNYIRAEFRDPVFRIVLGLCCFPVSLWYFLLQKRVWHLIEMLESYKRDQE